MLFEVEGKKMHQAKEMTNRKNCQLGQFGDLTNYFLQLGFFILKVQIYLICCEQFVSLFH